MTKPAEPGPVARWRARVGLSQVQLADRLGCAVSTVARWEQGRVAVTPDVWLALTAIEAGLEMPREAKP